MSAELRPIELGSDEFWKSLRDDPMRLAAEVCTIDLGRLEDTLARHSALHAWVSAAHEAARITEERARWEVTKARAAALLRAKSVTDPHTGRYKTVHVIDAEVEQDEDVRLTTERLMEAQERRAALRAMSKALEDRKDMLVQLSARDRQERKNYQ